LRDIYSLAQEDTQRDANIRELLEEAEAMAKRLVRKLYEYDKRADKGWWEKNPDWEQKILQDLVRKFQPKS
jgi:hypothetical protein